MPIPCLKREVTIQMSGEFQYVIRIAGTDIDGTQPVANALSNIKGVGIRLAKIIIERAGIESGTRIGFLSDTKINKIKDVLEKPEKYGILPWLLNHRKDRDTGTNRHLIGSDLIFQVKNDIDQMKIIHSWRGYRHSYGLKVRGQRTRTTSRKGKSVGVKKKRARRQP
jgi:small subunit ribosomal protein S13